jgi:DNA-binding beta-propeller fold protein YncE
LFVALGTGGTLIIPFNTSTGVQVTSPAPPQFSPPTGGANSNYWADDALAVNSSASVLYIVSSDTSSSDGVVAAYTIGSNGTQATLTTLGTGATAFQPTAVVLNSAGTYIYVANTSSDSISGFNTTVSGSTLPALGSSPYAFGYAPTALAVDRSGDYLFAVTSGGSPDMTMYSYDSTTLGKLDQAASTATGNGTEPAGVVAIAATH